MTNSDQGMDDIGLHLVDPGIPLAKPKPRVVRTAVVVDSTLVEQLVGEFRLTPEMSFTAVREGNRLFVTPAGESRYEVFAESPEKWFMRIVDATMEIERDTAGKVIGLWHQHGAPR